MDKRTLHRGFFAAAKPPVAAFLWMKLGYTCEKAKNLPAQYIVLANHVTDFDPLLVALGLPGHMYFVASSHVARWGLASKLLKTFLDPIWRHKGSVGTFTVKEILRRMKEGDNIAIFAEGNRSWDGRTCDIASSTGKLVKKSRCGLVTYKLSGGYLASPRWSTSTRRGSVRGAPVRVYTPQEIEAMSVDEINAAIRRDLSEDAYARQLAEPKAFRGKNLAEGMENLLFLCPKCAAEGKISSQGSTVRCEACGLEFTYDEFGMLHGLDQKTVTELSDWQKDQVRRDAEAGRVYSVAHGTLMTTDKLDLVAVDAGQVTMTAQALTCGKTVIPLEEISVMDIHGKRGVVLTAGPNYYELHPEGNGLKFLLLWQAYRSLEGQE